MRALSLPEAVPAGVEVWLLELDLHAPVPAADWAVLGEEEVARAWRYRRHADRVRSAVTRAALRRLLGARLRCPAASLRFEASCHGKPCLPNRYGILFNVSHSGEYALIALGAAPGLAAVGVDVERHDAEIDFGRMAEHALTPSERADLRQRCHDAAANPGGLSPAHAAGRPFVADFFLRWAGKEAVLKAIGVGIAEHLQDVSVQPLPGGGLDVHHTVPSWPALHAHALDVPGPYAAALAWQLKE